MRSAITEEKSSTHMVRSDAVGMEPAFRFRVRVRARVRVRVRFWVREWVWVRGSAKIKA